LEYAVEKLKWKEKDNKWGPGSMLDIGYLLSSFIEKRFGDCFIS